MGRPRLLVALLDADQAALLLETLGQRRAGLHPGKVFGVVDLEGFAHGCGDNGGPVAGNHPRGIEDDQRELEPEGAGRAAAEIGEAKEAALFVVLVEADKGARHQRAHQPSLLAKVLGHAAHVLDAPFIPDAAVNHAELVTQPLAALLLAEAVVVDGQLYDWGRIDDAAVSLSETAASRCRGLLANGDAVL